MDDYVYTIRAAKRRLLKQSSVLLFWPNSGVLVVVTKENFNLVASYWRLEK